MNKVVKFHKPSSPAFNEGEIWYGSGGVKVQIISVRKYHGATRDHTSDYGVTYFTNPDSSDTTHEKDCWNFQVRYQHSADFYVK